MYRKIFIYFIYFSPRFLIDRGSDLSMVNNDGELAVDVIDEAAMATLLNKEMAARGIDGRTARAKEER